MKVIALGASNSKNSINRQLASYAVSLIEGDVDTDILDLNDYDLPLYSIDIEQSSGIPDNAKAFFEKIGSSDAVIISLAEHNGSYTAAYKNLFDWSSRIDPKVFQNKPVVYLSTSPGPGGASSVLAAATASAPYFAADLKGSLSVPSFNNNWDQESNRLTDDDLNAQLKQLVNSL